MNVDDTPQGRLALHFVRSLVEGDYEAAHRLLDPRYGAGMPPSRLKQQYELMISTGNVSRIQVLDAIGIGPGDYVSNSEWVYVSITGADWIEAVTVLAVPRADDWAISDVVWGRP